LSSPAFADSDHIPRSVYP